MKTVRQIILIFLLLHLSSCIVQFIPDTEEDPNLLVVEGLLTDQPGINTIKLSISSALRMKEFTKPLVGSNVWISDNFENIYNLQETDDGTYVTNPAEFQGTAGRLYVLHIKTNGAFNNYTYESYPMEMKPVPSIDSIYFERNIIRPFSSFFGLKHEGCQIYFNSFDPTNSCNYFRWDYCETWEFHLPYDVINNVCWITNYSSTIHIKNTSILEESRISRYPLQYISDETDRLKVKYSILLNQYSLNEDEFTYWEKLQNLAEEIGTLYDIIPSTVPGNMNCIEDPNEQVLGYFSVSALYSKRFFIDEYFSGIVDLYVTCPYATIPGTGPIEFLDSQYWIIADHTNDVPPYRIITDKKGCADCTVRGTTIKPDFWEDN